MKYILIILALLVIPLASAQFDESDVLLANEGENTTVFVNCANCTFVRISITDPDNIQWISNVSATTTDGFQWKIGVVPNKTGDFKVNSVGNPNGKIVVLTYIMNVKSNFPLGLSLTNNQLSNYVIIALIVILGISIVFGYFMVAGFILMIASLWLFYATKEPLSLLILLLGLFFILIERWKKT